MDFLLFFKYSSVLNDILVLAWSCLVLGLGLGPGSALVWSSVVLGLVLVLFHVPDLVFVQSWPAWSWFGTHSVLV